MPRSTRARCFTPTAARRPRRKALRRSRVGAPWRLAPSARESKQVEPVVLVGDVDESAGVRKDVFRLRDERAGRKHASPFQRIGRYELTDLARKSWVRDVVDPKSSVEPREQCEVLPIEVRGVALRLVEVVRAEAATSFAEIAVRRSRWRSRKWKQGNEPRRPLFRDVDNACQAHLPPAVLLDRVRGPGDVAPPLRPYCPC